MTPEDYITFIQLKNEERWMNMLPPVLATEVESNLFDKLCEYIWKELVIPIGIKEATLAELHHMTQLPSYAFLYNGVIYRRIEA